MNIHVVLVRTIYSGNLGYVARVMANMGAKSLILIDPQCEINSQSRKTAAGAQSYLDRIVNYENWEKFNQSEGQGPRFAFCCREGKDRALRDFREQMDFFNTAQVDTEFENVYLVFGPEDNGLDTLELEHCHFRCRLPTFGNFQSMNLSHAVCMALFIYHDRIRTPAKLRQKPFRLKASKRSFYSPDDTLRNWISAMGFELNGRQGSAYKVMRRLLLQNAPNDYDLTVFEAVIKQCIRRLNKEEDDEDLAGFLLEDGLGETSDVSLKQ